MTLQGLLVNCYISLDITGTIFEKKSSLIDINDQLYWSIIIFLREIEATKPYLIEFEKYDFIKSKLYLEDCIVGNSNKWLIIFIKYDKNTFNVYNSQQQV